MMSGKDRSLSHVRVRRGKAPGGGSGSPADPPVNFLKFEEIAVRRRPRNESRSHCATKPPTPGDGCRRSARRPWKTPAEAGRNKDSHERDSFHREKKFQESSTSCRGKTRPALSRVNVIFHCGTPTPVIPARGRIGRGSFHSEKKSVPPGSWRGDSKCLRAERGRLEFLSTVERDLSPVGGVRRGSRRKGNCSHDGKKAAGEIAASPGDDSLQNAILQGVTL